MNKDSVVQILLGVIGTLATLLGVWVAWRVSGGRFKRRGRQPQILPTYPDQQTRPSPRWHVRQTTYISTDENPWLDSHGNWIPEIEFSRVPRSPGTAGDLRR